MGTCIYPPQCQAPRIQSARVSLYAMVWIASLPGDSSSSWLCCLWMLWMWWMLCCIATDVSLSSQAWTMSWSCATLTWMLFVLANVQEDAFCFVFVKMMKKKEEEREKRARHSTHWLAHIYIDYCLCSFPIFFQKGNLGRNRPPLFLSPWAKAGGRDDDYIYINLKRSGMNPNPLVSILFCYRMSTPIKQCRLVAIHNSFVLYTILSPYIKSTPCVFKFMQKSAFVIVIVVVYLLCIQIKLKEWFYLLKSECNGSTQIPFIHIMIRTGSYLDLISSSFIISLHSSVLQWIASIWSMSYLNTWCSTGERTSLSSERA